MIFNNRKKDIDISYLDEDIQNIFPNGIEQKL